MTARSRLRSVGRRLGFGLPTVLGLARRGFFIPYRHADGIAAPGARDLYPAMASLFAGEAAGFAETLLRLTDYAGALDRIAAGADGALARFDQDWFPRLDAAMAYTMVRWWKPKRIVEVGSGHSTRFIARAVAEGGLDSAITAIDPEPRADLARLPITLICDLVPRSGLGPFEALGAGDLLSIDSSHVLMPGTDVDFLLSTVLPRLAPGTLVQIHDVFLPDDYPSDWAWRGYNEQSGVAALLAGGGWRPLFSSHWVATRMADLVKKSPASRWPLLPGARESSLWIERRR